jgi:uncharacterized membrane protein
MDAKQIIGVFLIVAGLVGLVPGVLSIFEGKQILGYNPWSLVILGVILFAAGISLMKSIRTPTTTINKIE